MGSPFLLVFAMLCALLVASAQQPAVPDNPAGHTLQAFLDAFNSGDRARIDPYVRTYDPSKSGDPYLKFRNEWGGLRLLTIDSSDASYIAFTARQIGAPVLIMGSLTPGNA